MSMGEAIQSHDTVPMNNLCMHGEENNLRCHIIFFLYIYIGHFNHYLYINLFIRRRYIDEIFTIEY